jgi:hypothetical protein
MGRSQNSFIKRQKEKKRLLKRKQKEERKKERLENNTKGGDLSDMIAYVDEDGNLTSEPPGETNKEDN